MKKVIVFLVILSFAFTYQLYAKQDKKVIVIKKSAKTKHVKGMDIEAWRVKRDQYVQEHKKREEDYFRQISMSGTLDTIQPQAVNIQLYPTSTYFKPDLDGDIIFTGACYNAGSSSAVFVKIEVMFYDISNNLLGTDYTYVWGGSNVLLTSSGLYTNALGAGEVGFFNVWTDNIPYDKLYSYVYRFVWYTYAHTAAKANLDFDGSVFKRDTLGYLELYGSIKNPSSSYVTYFTQVYFAVFDPTNTYVIDSFFTYVDGASYGSSSSAIFPGTSESFSVWFPFTAYNNTGNTYYAGIRWNEDMTGGGLPEKDPPFGQFATPNDNANVSGSIAVTGWALDDSGVDNVKIYRTEGNTDVYIGEALMVEGARPDVAATYPQYPFNTRAGWGYMMLTNFLPNGGNGTFIMKAIATDIVGKKTTLGIKTIHVDNANAVKPFGAIDTPGQGGTASGSSFVNWGWVLTPMPNNIPTDGSTINVWVNGINLGHPNYNIYRSDIANLFPGFANSTGAVGYFYLDTTGYANGVHTIQWTATDTGSNIDGIGSRYFTIQNTGSDALMPEIRRQNVNIGGELSRIAIDDIKPIFVRKGFNENNIESMVYSGDDSNYRIRIKELEPLRIKMPKSYSIIACYQLIGNSIGSKPAGMLIKNNVINWMPGVAYMGNHRFVVLSKNENGELSKTYLSVTIEPKFRMEK